MNSSQSNPVLTNAKLLLLSSLLLAAVSTPTLSRAQDKNPLTPKYLIGDAVSLSNQSSYPEIEKAIQRFRNSDPTGARDYLESAKKKYSKLAPADVMMAKMYLLARNTRGVQLYLERAATQHPNDPEAYLMLADQAFMSQRTVEALVLFEYATPLVKNFTGNDKRKRNFQIRVLAGRAAVAERRREWEQARTWLKQWIAIEPENALAHTRMGIVLYRLEKATEALAEFSKAREINPNTAHPFVSMGRLSYSDGKNEEARKYFEKAYNENKTDPQVAQSYTEWLIQQRELDKAQEITAALRKQKPEAINALLLDGIVAYMQGKSDRAEQALQKVLSLDPRNDRATDLMALLLIKSENVQDKERALQYAQNNAERLRNNAQANVTRAYVLYELGRKAEAQKSLQQAGKMQIRPDSTYLIAKILVAEGRKDQAREALEKVVNQKSGLVIFRQEAEDLYAQLQGGNAKN